MNNTKPSFGLFSFHNFDSRLLVISDNVSFLEWVREAAAEYELRITKNLCLFDGYKDMDNNTCIKFKVDSGKLIEQQSADAVISDMNRLVLSWADNYKNIVNTINHQRKHLSTAFNFNFQTVIYQSKFKEAQNILKGNANDLKFLDSEAIYKNISLHDMAQRVILENDMFMGFLARTELLRVKWLKTLQISRNIKEHQTIRKDFTRELYEYHLLS